MTTYTSGKKGSGGHHPPENRHCVPIQLMFYTKQYIFKIKLLHNPQAIYTLKQLPTPKWGAQHNLSAPKLLVSSFGVAPHEKTIRLDQYYYANPNYLLKSILIQKRCKYSILKTPKARHTQKLIRGPVGGI